MECHLFSLERRTGQAKELVNLTDIDSLVALLAHIWLVVRCLVYTLHNIIAFVLCKHSMKSICTLLGYMY